MTNQSGERRVAGLIDAGGVYCARAAAADGFVFFASTAIDDTGRIAAEAVPAAPYAKSESARARAQAACLVENLGEALNELGSSINNICQIEQYVKLKAHADPYFTVVTAPGLMGRSRPQGATAQLSGLFPAESVVSVTGLAIVPDPGADLVKTYPDEDPDPASEGPVQPARGRRPLRILDVLRHRQQDWRPSGGPRRCLELAGLGDPRRSGVGIDHAGRAARTCRRDSGRHRGLHAVPRRHRGSVRVRPRLRGGLR